jgi:TonB family protein
VDQIDVTPKKKSNQPLIQVVFCGLLGLNLLWSAITWSTVNSVVGRQQSASESLNEASENFRRLSTRLANQSVTSDSQAKALKKDIDQLFSQLAAVKELAVGAQNVAYKATNQNADNQDATNRQLAKILAAIPKSRIGAGSNTFDDLIISRIASQWKYPEGASAGKRAELNIAMQPDGTISAAHVITSSGDIEFDKALVEAVRSVSRIPELAGVDAETFSRLYAERKLIYVGEAKAL